MGHKWFFYGIDAKTLFLEPLFLRVFDAECMCLMYSPHAISKIFSFPGLVLTTAGFILAGVSQTEWSLSRDLSITGCARPHSAANQIVFVLPVLVMGVSGGLLGIFHLPPSHLSLSTATLLFKCFFAEEWCYSLDQHAHACVFSKCLNRAVLWDSEIAFSPGQGVVGCA